MASQSRIVSSHEADARTLPSELWPSSVCFRASVVASQSLTVLSHEADARTLPSGEKATALTKEL